MRTYSFSFAILLLMAASAGIETAAAACQNEVLAALEKQRKAAAFRMQTSMLSEQGPLRMVVDYRAPDRMRQVVTRAIAPDQSTETILVGSKAWGKDGATWVELSAEVTRDLSGQLDEVFGDAAGAIGTVACLGSTSIDGRELMAYRIENDAQVGPKDMSPDAKAKAAAALADPSRPIRMFYIDPKSGLPARSVFARADRMEKPVFKAEYTYDDAIKIEPPK